MSKEPVIFVITTPSVDDYEKVCGIFFKLFFQLPYLIEQSESFREKFPHLKFTYIEYHTIYWPGENFEIEIFHTSSNLTREAFEDAFWIAAECKNITFSQKPRFIFTPSLKAVSA